VAKRSPILGYNHNVLYRGLVFHVQTEDSGLMSPHLFTHLFYGGVILSTRKLVYDAGSAEEAIKGLMQSQHKIVLKDLKRGTFDDKIDQYLAGTEGLLPRTTPAGAAPAARVAPAAEPPVRAPRPQTEELQALDLIEPPDGMDRPSEPMITIEHDSQPSISRTATPPPIPSRVGTPLPRTQTADRKSSSSRVNVMPPPPPNMDEIDPPTDPDVDSGAIAMALGNATVRTPMANLESGPEISIKLELDDDDGIAQSRTRSKHDTDVQMPGRVDRAQTESDGVPGSIGGSASAPNRPEKKTGERAPALGAAALPPVRPVTRPPSRQAITPPPVMSRPIAEQDRSDAIEVYAPAPGSVEPPPGERAERPGQYAQHKRPSSTKLPVDAIKGGDRSGAVPIPSGLARPSRASSGMPPIQQPTRPQTASQQPVQARTGSPSSAPPNRPQSPSQQPMPARTGTPSSDSGVVKGRTPTPSRVSPPGTGPTARGSGSGGVVMTRPAVIVGAPAKPQQPPRVRKAREEEGRGFGQGLISEKSLDEVILAYLSEDADEK
jgi:hypothetical protein